jgi:hypothetical protein
MKIESKIYLSQSEAFALRDKTLLKSRSLSAALESATGEKIAEPTLGKNSATVFQDISVLEAHCSTVQDKINAAVTSGIRATSTAPARADDKDKPDNKPAGNCDGCKGTGNCPTCGGTGKKAGKARSQAEDCPTCGGNGKCKDCNGGGTKGEKEKAQVGTQGQKAAWNPDAKILEARGVKTLAELNQLPPADIGD